MSDEAIQQLLLDYSKLLAEHREIYSLLTAVLIQGGGRLVLPRPTLDSVLAADDLRVQAEATEGGDVLVLVDWSAEQRSRFI